MAIPPQAIKMTPRSAFKAINRTGYLPLELPPAITTKYFADYCFDNYAKLKQRQSDLLKLSTKFDTFTIPRNEHRRHLAVVHPLGHIALSLVIVQNLRTIKSIIDSHGTSLYSTSHNPKRNRIFDGLDFRLREIKQSELYSKYAFILKADISRFFYTIYTHSIPWAVLGKEKAKHLLSTNRSKLLTHWSSKIDVALQTCQSRETFGIPVGPDSSRIVAEILLSAIEDNHDFSSTIRNSDVVRLLDDYIIGFNDMASAEDALVKLRAALWRFNLQLNDEKTSISHSRQLFREEWRLYFDTAEIADGGHPHHERDIRNLVDSALRYCVADQSGRPASWACRRLAQLQSPKRNFSVIMDALFRLARAYPSCIHLVAAFLINNQQECSILNLKAKILYWIKSIIKLHIKNHRDFEVAWCLVVAGVYRIKFEYSDIDNFDGRVSSVVFAMLAMLRDRGLLLTKLSSFKWRSKVKASGILGHDWLVYYEAVNRGWTKDRAMIAAVNNNVFLGDMLGKKVTFLEDRIFDARHIDISKRAFRGSAGNLHSTNQVPQNSGLSSEEEHEQDSYDFQLFEYD